MQLIDKHLQIIKRHDRTDTQFLVCFPNLVVKLKHLDSTNLPFSAISFKKCIREIILNQTVRTKILSGHQIKHYVIYVVVNPNFWILCLNTFTLKLHNFEYIIKQWLSH